jgi:hypothetical protein
LFDQPPTPQAPSRKPISVQRKLAATVGAVIVVLSGGCTIHVIWPLLGGTDPLTRTVLGFALVIGGLPLIVGLVIVLVALGIRR